MTTYVVFIFTKGMREMTVHSVEYLNDVTITFNSHVFDFIRILLDALNLVIDKLLRVHNNNVFFSNFYVFISYFCV